MTQFRNNNRGAQRQEEASYGDVHAKFEGQIQSNQEKHCLKQFNGPRQDHKGQADGQPKKQSNGPRQDRKGQARGPHQDHEGKPTGNLPAKAHTG